MGYFETAFVLLMLLFPGVFTLFVRQRESGQMPDGEDATLGLAAKQRRLWTATAAAILGYLALSLSGIKIAAYMMWIVFLPLWFFLAMPVLRAKDPGWRGIPRTPVRTATLKRRDVWPPELERAWILLTIGWLLLLLGAAAGLVFESPGAHLWWVMGFPLIGGAELALFYRCGKGSLAEPEPSAPAETPEIRSARDGLRRLKLWGWFGAAVVMTLVFSVPALILIWWDQSALTAAIIVGAGGGALGGIGGGVFGTMADLRRAKLNRLCLEASTERAVPAAN
jgi:hypothetical protein